MYLRRLHFYKLCCMDYRVRIRIRDRIRDRVSAAQFTCVHVNL